MKTCTFFGHREFYEEITPQLINTIENLIIHDHVDSFYVGNQGQFDALVRRILAQMEQKYAIRYSVVLAYLPGERSEEPNLPNTIFPEGMELVHPRFAIDRRNRWMVEHSDYVVAYLTRSWGGAARYVEMAKRKGKVVISLKDCPIP